MTSRDYRMIAVALDCYAETYASEPDKAETERAKEMAEHYWALALEAEERVGRLRSGQRTVYVGRPED